MAFMPRFALQPSGMPSGYAPAHFAASMARLPMPNQSLPPLGTTQPLSSSPPPQQNLRAYPSVSTQPTVQTTPNQRPTSLQWHVPGQPGPASSPSSQQPPLQTQAADKPNPGNPEEGTAEKLKQWRDTFNSRHSSFAAQHPNLNKALLSTGAAVLLIGIPSVFAWTLHQSFRRGVLGLVNLIDRSELSSGRLAQLANKLEPPSFKMAAGLSVLLAGTLYAVGKVLEPDEYLLPESIRSKRIPIPHLLGEEAAEPAGHQQATGQTTDTSQQLSPTAAKPLTVPRQTASALNALKPQAAAHEGNVLR